MFPDHSLMPKEALRLAALGMLAEQPMPYGALASAVRSFVHHIMGPSPDAMGSSIELLRYEGLIRATGREDGGREDGAQEDHGREDGANAPLMLTAKGREEFVTLMLATVRAPFNDLNKLVVALKLRFLPLLPADRRADQAALLIEASRVELARLIDLRARHAAEPGTFHDWLDHDIGQAEARLAWFERLGRDL